MIYPSSLSSRTVSAVYTRAQALERSWHNLRLADDFSGRMVDAVFRHMRRLEDRGEVLIGEAQSTLAVKFLEYFWSRNAKRDYARQQKRSQIISLSDEIQLPWAKPTCSHDTDAAIATCLIAQGEPAAITWAFVFRRSGLRWAEVAEAVSHKTGAKCSPAQARQWECRHFGRIETKLAELARRLEL